MGLHGIDMVTVPGGAVSISAVDTAIIGIIGTAPDAQGATGATCETGSVVLNTAILFTLTGALAGRKGNNARVTAKAGEPETAAVSVAITGSSLEITLATDADGLPVSTALEVMDAVNIADLDVLAESNGGLDTGVVQPFSDYAFTGGQDEPYPLGVPWLINGSDSAVDALGDDGTLKTAINEAYANARVQVVGIRVEKTALPASQEAAIVAGMSAFALAQSTLKVHPRIFIAPEFSEDDTVGKALESIATRLSGVAYLDSPSMATMNEVVQRRDKYGERVEILRPRVLTADSDGVSVYRPYSAYAAGLRAAVDLEYGFWYSKSNHEVLGFEGLEQVDSWSIGDEASDANQLNMNNVSTIIAYGGYKHWGNRNCSTDPDRYFEVAVRTDDVLRDSIQSGLQPYLDRPLDVMLANDAISSVNAFLREMKALGAIHGGEAWLDTELNTASTLALGHLYIDYDYGFKSPTERITCRVHLNTNYAVEALNG